MVSKKNNKQLIPILNRGTWSRVYSITSSIEKVLKSVKEYNPEIDVNIINLGSGFDTLYFILQNKFDNFKYYEFDYDEIVYKKMELIKKSKTLTDVITQNKKIEIKIGKGCLTSKNYSLYECDVINYEQFNQIICSIKDLNCSNPTIVIAECLLVYLKKDISESILVNLTSTFKNIIFLEYDLVGAHDNFGKEMVYNLLDRDIKLSGYEDTPDVMSQIKRLTKTGFKQVEVYDMLEYYEKYIDKMEKSRIEHLEFVDEYEEWKLLQSHACSGYGTKLEANYEYINTALKLN
jgi:hypothetical protein